MTDLIERYTFQNYETQTQETEEIKEKAVRYCSDSGWLYISGRSGSGKTHICTAICKKLIQSGTDVYYMQWRDESVNLKSAVNDTEYYNGRMRKLKTVPVLYIDDFLKGSDTDADIRLAFEIMNSRYNDRSLKTIISSELDITAVLNRDEALGGRIYERAKGYMLKAPALNWRLK